MKYDKSKAQGSALTTFLGGIAILLAVLFLLVKLATSGYFYHSVEESTPTAIETRIMSAGQVQEGDGTPVGQRTGEQIFNKICIQCHAVDSTVANAPRLGNAADWGPRIAKGFAVLVNSGINGFNAGMPARGGASDLTDDEVARAVAYMTNESGGNFEAPAVNADGASDAAVPADSAAAGGDVKADGKAVFDKLCVACHASNSAIAYSPKLTDQADWAPRIKQGKETLFKHAIEGYTGPQGGIMPAKGGNAALTDDEVKAAVVYMVNQSGGQF
ncbi:cytochrome c5 [Neisseria sp. HSC-16F19]|nr:c-type cytochrome [Neisseria sp. HSC-16F19]MCP2041476.1 cytochrome c5 [Neisseria sp. HSC-16F19]